MKKLAETKRDIVWETSLIDKALLNGDLDMAKCMREHGCPISRGAGIKLSGKGELDCIHWIISHGVPLHGKMYCDAAAAGHLHVMKWLHENTTCDWDTHAFKGAAARGDIPMLEWMLQHHEPVGTHSIAASVPHGWTVIQWMREHGFEWDYLTTQAAARIGNLELLRLLESKIVTCPSQNCPVTRHASLDAASEGHLHVLNWLYNKGYHMGQSMGMGAGEKGHLHVLKWMKEKGLPFDCMHGTLHGVDFLCSARAARGGHLHVLRWLRRETNCVWREGPICNAAASRGYVDILKWALEEEGMTPAKNVCMVAAMNGQTATFDYVTKMGYPAEDPDQAMRALAISRERTEN
ncbi:unnamed protein product [Chrysoparadoxa australica]